MFPYVKSKEIVKYSSYSNLTQRRCEYDLRKLVPVPQVNSIQINKYDYSVNNKHDYEIYQ